MCPIGFALWLTLNPTWWTADHLSALQQSAPLPASLQAALTAIPEESPWEIPLIRECGSPELSPQERQQAWVRQSFDVWNEVEWNADRSPILDDAAQTCIAWTEILSGRNVGRWPRMSHSRLRPVASSDRLRTEWLLIEFGPCPAWLPTATHGRLQTPDLLFQRENQDLPQGIRCRRAMVQVADGYFRGHLSVWAEAAD